MIVSDIHGSPLRHQLTFSLGQWSSFVSFCSRCLRIHRNDPANLAGKLTGLVRDCRRASPTFQAGLAKNKCKLNSDGEKDNNDSNNQRYIGHLQHNLAGSMNFSFILPRKSCNSKENESFERQHIKNGRSLGPAAARRRPVCHLVIL